MLSLRKPLRSQRRLLRRSKRLRHRRAPQRGLTETPVPWRLRKEKGKEEEPLKILCLSPRPRETMIRRCGSKKERRRLKEKRKNPKVKKEQSKIEFDEEFEGQTYKNMKKGKEEKAFFQQQQQQQQQQ